MATATVAIPNQKNVHPDGGTQAIVVDEADVPLLQQHTWVRKYRTILRNFVVGGRRKRQRLEEALGFTQPVYHVDGNAFNFSRANLRVVPSKVVAAPPEVQRTPADARLHPLVKDSLYGLRILHYLSCIRFDSSDRFLSQCDSNFKVFLQTLTWLPAAHHYVLLPDVTDITPENTPALFAPNVTRIAFPYPPGGVKCARWFDLRAMEAAFDWSTRDVDLIFCHRPEVAAELVLWQEHKRAPRHVGIVTFFHWVSCAHAQPRVAQRAQLYFRQAEGLALSDFAFVHSLDVLTHLSEPCRGFCMLAHNTDNVLCMPLSYPLCAESIPWQCAHGQLPLVVFNHRIANTTGAVCFQEEVLPLLRGSCIVVFTDPTTPPREGAIIVPHVLSRGEYRNLLEQCVCTVAYRMSFLTWNLSVQDGLQVSKPTLVVCPPHQRPVFDAILGTGYPHYYENAEALAQAIKTLASAPTPFTWTLPDHAAIFREALLGSVQKWTIRMRGWTQEDARTELPHDTFVNKLGSLAEGRKWPANTRCALLSAGFGDDIEQANVAYFVKE